MRNMNDDSGAVVRLDIALVERGVTDSRSKAQRLIESGKVRVNGIVASKASLKVTAADTLDADLGDDYVSRGAYKLVGAFDMFSQTGLRSAEGFDCLDIGASTGGFCDVLLRRGAAHVIALDVGHGQLDPRIAGNERIIEMSGVNIRDVEADDLPYRPSMIVSDVSFISLTYVIPSSRASPRPAHTSCCWSNRSSKSAKATSAKTASWKAKPYANRRSTPSPPARKPTDWMYAPRRSHRSKARTATSSICCMQWRKPFSANR